MSERPSERRIESSPDRATREEPSLPLVARSEAFLGYDSQPVLRGVNLEIRPGDFIGLAGPNGSGKTTLLRSILGFLPVLSGSVIRNCALAGFGYVPQSASLDPNFPLTAAEVVEMGAYGRLRGYEPMPSAEKKKARGALERVGMSRVAGKSFFALSGGQKQRVLIARALMVDPRVLILDEPLSGVDKDSQSVITGLLLALNRDSGLAVFFSSHDLALIRRLSAKILRVEQGGSWWEGKSSLADP